MKKSKRLIAGIICVALLICSWPVANFASGGKDPLSRMVSGMIDSIRADSNGYDVKNEDTALVLYINGIKAGAGLHTDGTDYYYVMEDGTLAADKVQFVYNTRDLLERAYYNFDAEGRLVADGWFKVGDRQFYTRDAQHASGLTYIDGHYYFFNINNSEMQVSSTIFIGENEYRVEPGIYEFDGDGIMIGEPEILPDTTEPETTEPETTTPDSTESETTAPNPEDPEPTVQATATNVKASNAFSDNMMFQRDKKLSVWGAADASSGTVVVTLGDQQAVATVGADRIWKATFDNTFAADGEGKTLRIYGADGMTQFDDILIGDVYFVIGQSNVHFSLQDQINGMEQNGLTPDWDYSDDRDIRFYRNSSLYTATLTGLLAPGTATEFVDVIPDHDWMTPSQVEENLYTYTASDTTNRAFSALGYLMAYNLSNEIDIPIGVIEIDAAGMPLTAFAPNSLAAQWGDEILNAQTGVYTYYLRNGFLNQPAMTSRFVYNQLINPLKDFATAGVVWYQGESDLLNSYDVWQDDRTYATQFSQLMTYYRQTFGDGQGNFPVYMIEFPTCYSNMSADGTLQNAYMPFGNVRCDQGIISQKLSNFHLVNSADFFSNIVWSNSLHPYIKEKQAARLADIMLANSYGIGDINYVKGPQMSSVTYSGSSATITFNNVGSGLKKQSGSHVYGFEVWTGTYDAAGNKAWTVITDSAVSGSNKVVINAGATIRAIRYHANTEASMPGFGDSFPALSINLTNSNNIPASAFVDFK